MMTAVLEVERGGCGGEEGESSHSAAIAASTLELANRTGSSADCMYTCSPPIEWYVPSNLCPASSFPKPRKSWMR